VTLDKYIDLPNISEDEKKLGKGVKNIVSKQFLDALETFEYLVELHPDNKEYQYLLGECYFHGTENTLKALDAFEDALSLDPEFELANIHLIDLYMLEKRYDKTIALLERELEKNPKSLGALSNLGIIKLHQGRSEEGIEIANQILEIDSAHFGAKFGKTLGLLELNRFDEAEPLILDLQKESKSPLQSFLLKNGFYYLQGKFLERREALLKVFNEKSKSFDKKDAFYRQVTAKAILFGTSVSKDIKNQKNNIIQFKGINDPEVMLYIDFLYNMAWAHAVLGDLESFDHYQKRIQNLINEKELTNSWEKDYIPLTYLDAAYFKQDWKQVITEYRNISNSRSGQIFRDLCRLKKCEAEFHLKKYDIALLTAGKMVSPDQDYRTFPFSRPFGYYWQGRIYEELGKQNQAIASYEKLMELWKDGDERIPERRDTIKRLKKLKKVS